MKVGRALSQNRRCAEEGRFVCKKQSLVPRRTCWTDSWRQTAGRCSRSSPHLHINDQPEHRQLSRRSARVSRKQQRRRRRSVRLRQEVAVQSSAEQKQGDVLQPSRPGSDGPPDLRLHSGKPVQTQRHGRLWHLFLLTNIVGNILNFSTSSQILPVLWSNNYLFSLSWNKYRWFTSTHRDDDNTGSVLWSVISCLCVFLTELWLLPVWVNGELIPTFELAQMFYLIYSYDAKCFYFF